jgi:hypothetical protein
MPNTKLIPSLIVGLTLALLPVFAAPAAGFAEDRIISANIPLDSYIYTYLAKLDGLGYLPAMPNNTKPYTRIQVARWVAAIRGQAADDAGLPAYARTMLAQLLTEFQAELALLNGETVGGRGFNLREIDVAGAVYDGESLAQHGNPNTLPQPRYQPLVINNNGYQLADGMNSTVKLVIEGRAADDLLFNLTPRLDTGESEAVKASLESGYLKTRYRNLQVQLGRVPLWWGPGGRGNLGLTNNATPFTAIHLSNLEPIRPDGLFKFLNQVDINAFYADLEKQRDDVNSPGFAGWRVAVTPSANFTIAGTLNAMLGGEGHELHLSDLGDFITGKNAETSVGDKWNSIAGFDFCWRLPMLNGLQLYGEVYGEDQAGKLIPLPSKNAYLVGIKLPRLVADGRWELRLETAATTNVWYVHGLYKEGYTYHGHLIGDAMGYNAERYNLKLCRYLADGSWLSVNLEHLTMDRDAVDPQQVNSVWVSYHRNLRTGLILGVTLGCADLDNQNYQAGRSGRNYLGSISLSKRFR